MALAAALLAVMARLQHCMCLVPDGTNLEQSKLAFPWALVVNWTGEARYLSTLLEAAADNKYFIPQT